MKWNNQTSVSLFLLSACMTITLPVNAAGNASDLAKASQNPISTMISLPFENNTYGNSGPDNKTMNVLNVKPVLPVKLNEDWNLINRAIVPIISQPGADGTPTSGGTTADLVSSSNSDIHYGHLVTPAHDGTSTDRKNGVGDTTYQGFFSPAKPIKMGGAEVSWGAGVQLQIPTHSDDRLGTSRWAAGPAAVVLVMDKHWVYGGVLSQVWDITDNKSNEDISAMTFQPFVNYNFGKGWYVSSAPVITANWEAKGSDQWTIPLGGGVGRVVHIGKQAVNFKAAVYGNVAKPENGPDYNVQLSATFLFPK